MGVREGGLLELGLDELCSKELFTSKEFELDEVKLRLDTKLSSTEIALTELEDVRRVHPPSELPSAKVSGEEVVLLDNSPTEVEEVGVTPLDSRLNKSCHCFTSFFSRLESCLSASATFLRMRLINFPSRVICAWNNEYLSQVLPRQSGNGIPTFLGRSSYSRTSQIIKLSRLKE